MVNKVVYISSQACSLCKLVKTQVEKIALPQGVPVEWIDAGAIPQEYIGPIKDAGVSTLPIILVKTELGITVFGRTESSKLDLKEFEKVVHHG